MTPGTSAQTALPRNLFGDRYDGDDDDSEFSVSSESSTDDES